MFLLVVSVCHIVSSAAFSRVMAGTDGGWTCADGRTGREGWHTQKRKTWVSGQVRAEKGFGRTGRY